MYSSDVLLCGTNLACVRYCLSQNLPVGAGAYAGPVPNRENRLSYAKAVHTGELF